MTGTYKPNTGSAHCTKCVAGQYSPAVAATSDICIDCVAGKFSSVIAASEITTCQNCAAGSYSASDVGNTGCTLCAMDTFSAVIAATSVSVCQSCNSTQVSIAGQTQCTTCENGKYKAENLVVCSVCRQRHFCTGGIAIQCDGNSQTVPLDRVDAAEPRDCQCNTGYAHRIEGERDTDSVVFDNVCHACEEGFFSEEIKSIQCSKCDAGYSSTIEASSSEDNCEICPASTFSASGVASCTSCQANSQLPARSSISLSCICNAGYTGENGQTCSACSAGKYKIATGSSLCISCLAGTFSVDLAASASETCQTCTSNSHSPQASDSHTDCICNAGSTGSDGGACVECAADKYKVATGDMACINCLAGEYSTVVGAVANECNVCPEKSHSPEASNLLTKCTCNAGATGSDGTICEHCDAGKYKTLPGNAVCDSCESGTFSVVVGASAVSVCQACTPNSDAPLASENALDCLCDMGFIKKLNLCEKTLANTFKSSAGDTFFENCPAFSASPAGSVANTDCVCNAGYNGDPGNSCGFICPAGAERDASNTVCNDCNTSFLKPNAGDHACTPCPDFSFHILTGQTTMTPCLCQAGYVWNTDTLACDKCAATTFNNKVNDTRCFDCISHPPTVAYMSIEFVLVAIFADWH